MANTNNHQTKDGSNLFISRDSTTNMLNSINNISNNNNNSKESETTIETTTQRTRSYQSQTQEKWVLRVHQKQME